VKRKKSRKRQERAEEKNRRKWRVVSLRMSSLFRRERTGKKRRGKMLKRD
jgi:hypothetical protein